MQECQELNSFSIKCGAVCFSGACDDQNACTSDDRCIDGTCSGTPIECPADTDCVTYSCNAATGNCNATVKTGDPCTLETTDLESFTCREDGSCVGEPKVCEPRSCFEESCDSKGGCQYDFAAENTPCNDGDATTCNDKCSLPSTMGIAEPVCEGGECPEGEL